MTDCACDLRQIRLALEKARLSLEWANGCFQTDRPELLRSVDDDVPLEEILWKGDERKELALIRRAMEALERLEGVNNTNTDP